MPESTRGLLLAGVGGQGVILGSMIVADALMGAGFDVKQSEVHGMAQRGGSVFSHIRWGERVDSPLVPFGSADVLAAFEWAEAIRWLQYLRTGGAVVVDVRTIVPPGACVDRRAWARRYPGIESDTFDGREFNTRLIDAAATATEMGNVRAANSVLIGAAAAFIDIDEVHWFNAIEKLVPPKTVDVNVAAFRAGRDGAQAEIPTPAPEPEGFPGPHEIEINHAWCKASNCNICSMVCPEYCLAVNADGKLIIPNPEGCTGCDLCVLLCPDFAIEINPPGTALAASAVGVGGNN